MTQVGDIYRERQVEAKKGKIKGKLGMLPYHAVASEGSSLVFERAFASQPEVPNALKTAFSPPVMAVQYAAVSMPERSDLLDRHSAAAVVAVVEPPVVVRS